MLVAQIVTGVVLVMHYAATADGAFNSVEHIMRDVNFGWLIRYLHANGASMFFLAVYIHMFRGLYYGSYKAPREVLWILGVIIYLLMMATGFMGYVLPWGQMSFWAATVITNLFSAIPLVGEPIVPWLRGGFAVGEPTLQPVLLAALSPAVRHPGRGGAARLGAACGGPEQSGRRRAARSEKDDGRLHARTLTLKDALGVGVFLHRLGVVRVLHPELPRPRQTTTSRRIPRCYAGAHRARSGTTCRSTRSCARSRASYIGVDGAVFGRSPFSPSCRGSTPRRCGSATYRPLYRQFFWIFVAVCVGLGWLGSKPAEGGYVLAGAGAHRLVFPALHRGAAAARPRREAEAAAELDFGSQCSSTEQGDRSAVAVFLAGAALLMLGTPTPAAAQEHEQPDPAGQHKWSFAGVFGHYDPGSILQRGFKVYRDVLPDLPWPQARRIPHAGRGGRPRLSARPRSRRSRPMYKVKDGSRRPGRRRPIAPAGRPTTFPPPFPNDAAARFANNGALPARHVGARQGAPVRARLPRVPARYRVALSGARPRLHRSPSSRATPRPASRHGRCRPACEYNTYFPGHALGMPPPAQRRLGKLHRRRAGNRRPVCQGRLRPS